MQYVIETTLVRFGGEEDDVDEKILENASVAVATEAARKAEADIPEKERFYKVVLWEEYESMEEAPVSDGGCYRLLERDWKLWLRRCRISTERRG